MTNTVVTRAEAKALRLTTYFTGNPCKFGHIAKRGTKNGGCVECVKGRRPAYAAKHADRIARYNKQWRQKNPDRLADYEARRDKERSRRQAREWARNNKERKDAYRASYLKANQEKMKTWRRNGYLRRRNEILAKRRAFTAANPDIAAKWSASCRCKRNADPAKVKAVQLYMRTYYDQNKVALAAYHAAYAKDNAAKTRCWGQARLARKVNAPGRGVTDADVDRMLVEQDFACAYCREHDRLTLDHVQALINGGAHDPCNTLMACKPCNSGKKHLDVVEFLERLTERRQAKGLWTATPEQITAMLSSDWRQT